MIEISKELLEEVLKVKVLKYKLNKKSLAYDYFKNGIEYTSFHINSYELAHKCKEWAFKQDYSYLGNKGLINIYSKTGTMVAITDKNVVNWFDVYIDFKACEWIYMELNK